MKKSFFCFLFSVIVLISCNQNQSRISTADPAYDQKVDSLLSMMTLKEKIGQMNQYSVGNEITGDQVQDGSNRRYERIVNGEVGSVLNLVGAAETRKLQEIVMEETRLKIPLIFAYDVIHGYKTMFPIPLAESASWDLAAIEKSARIAAIETAASGVQWSFAPMVDVSRDARWGRVMEGAGEDPYYGSLVAKARIKGFQGDDLSDRSTIAACAKHFAAYGLSESGKDYNAVNVGQNTLHNAILPPFIASVEAGAATFMNAFNDVDGVPATANTYLLRDLLKGKWGFGGLVVSDWNSIGHLVPHGVAGDEYQASALALTAGCDIDMEADAYIENLEQLVQDGVVSEALIDDAVRRILRLKFQLGLFDDPYRYMDEAYEAEVVGSQAHREASLEVAKKSIVLLKNEGNLLPLENANSVAVIGPLAKDKDAPVGNWRAQGVPNSAVSFFEGFEARFNRPAGEMDQRMSIGYAEGCKLSIGPNAFAQELVIEENDRSGFAAAISLARRSEVVIMVLGEPALMSGEARSKVDISLPGLQLELLKEVQKVNPNIVLVLMNGRPLTLPWEAENIPAIVEAWHLGAEAGHAIAAVLAGDVNPSGKLPMSFPRHVGQLPLYYNSLNTGRPKSPLIFYHHHMDVERTALFPFGYGLSYTQFAYSDVATSVENDQVTISVSVTNTGDYDGEEVVQVYIRDVVASISRPILELKAFEKVMINKGESKDLSFSLSKKDLSFYKDGELTFEPGDFEISVGSDSESLETQTVTLN